MRSKSHSRAPRATIYETVTERIIEEMRRGLVPWVKPWKTSNGSTPVAMPVNAVSGHAYSGINILILWSAAINAGYPVPRWLTFRQALGLGGHVRKGEKGTRIVYAKRFVPKKERIRAEAADEEPHAVPMLKEYTVFNVQQCDELPDTHAVRITPPSPEEIDANANAFIVATRAEIRPGGDRAYYNIRGDFIGMPSASAFPDPLDYTRTLLHELGHWTGHTSRLDRKYGARFGDEAYAREELVAEMSCAFVCATLGIEPTVQHAAYIEHWLRVLENDNRAIFHAASHASRASDYLLALHDDEDRLAA